MLVSHRGLHCGVPEPALNLRQSGIGLGRCGYRSAESLWPYGGVSARCSGVPEARAVIDSNGEIGAATRAATHAKYGLLGHPI